MIKKICEFIKKYKLAVIVALFVIIMGVLGIIMFFDIGNNPQEIKLKNNNYSFKYDTSWKIILEEESKVSLEHESKSKINIEIVKLKEENKYSSIDDMLEELLYTIQKQNPNFKLLYKEKGYITKNEYDGYKMLYENDNSQAMVVVCKKSDEVIIFTYESTNNYFDILLDSVNNIIYNFDTMEETFDLSYNLSLNMSQINYNISSEVVDKVTGTKQYEIAHNNYYVKYSVPDKFYLTSIDSTASYFSFDGLDDGKISMNVNLYNRNIYEYLDKEQTTNVYSKYDTYKSNEDYSNFEEYTDEFNSDFESYIYKNSYYYDKAINYDKDFNSSYTSELRENILLMYALDENHILVIELSSSKVAIPKELIDMIKIDSSQNYSKFITSNKRNGYLTCNLKRIADRTKGTIEEVILNLPDKYSETEKILIYMKIVILI